MPAQLAFLLMRYWLLSYLLMLALTSQLKRGFSGAAHGKSQTYCLGT